MERSMFLDIIWFFHFSLCSPPSRRARDGFRCDSFVESVYSQHFFFLLSVCLRLLFMCIVVICSDRCDATVIVLVCIVFELFDIWIICVWHEKLTATLLFPIFPIYTIHNTHTHRLMSWREESTRNNIIKRREKPLIGVHSAREISNFNRC